MDPQDIYGGLSTGSGFMPWLMGQLKNGAAGVYNGFANAPPINTTPNAVARPTATPNAAGQPGLPGSPSGPAAPAAPPLPQPDPRAQGGAPQVGNPMNIAPPWATQQPQAGSLAAPSGGGGQGLIPRVVNSINGASANAQGQGQPQQQQPASQGLLPRLAGDISGAANWFKGLNFGGSGPSTFNPYNTTGSFY